MTENEQYEKLMSRREVADWLGVHIDTVLRWGIPCVRVWGVYRYDRAEVRAFLESHRLNTPVTPHNKTAQKQLARIVAPYFISDGTAERTNHSATDSERCGAAVERQS